jgi:rod shape-determining protein MreD
VRPAPSSNTGPVSALQATAGFVLLMLAQFGVRPLFPGRVAVDFALIAVLFTAVRLRPGVAALTGFLVGLAVDALAPDSFGTSTLVLTLIAFGASWLKAVFFADHVGLTGLFVFLGKWVFDIATTLLMGAAFGTSLAVTLLVWAPLSAALTALVAVLLLVLFRPLYRPSGR